MFIKLYFDNLQSKHSRHEEPRKEDFSGPMLIGHFRRERKSESLFNETNLGVEVLG